MGEEKTVKPWGRPKVVTEKVLDDLKYAFSIGCSDLEACAYAEISTTAFYTYQEKNEGFKEWKEEMKRKPILQAKKVICDKLNENDDHTAKWYLERKKKDEFSLRTENTGADGKDLKIVVASDKDKEMLEDV